jgi:hypothetical protein
MSPVTIQPIRYNHAEQDVVEFLAAFASVSSHSKKIRWKWERDWYATFNGSEVGNGYRSKFFGAASQPLEDHEANAAYESVRSEAESHHYVVIPDQPPTVLYECVGALPSILQWKEACQPNGLAFGLTLVEVTLRWTLALEGEYVGLPCAFAFRDDGTDL